MWSRQIISVSNRLRNPKRILAYIFWPRWYHLLPSATSQLFVDIYSFGGKTENQIRAFWRGNENIDLVWSLHDAQLALLGFPDKSIPKINKEERERLGACHFPLLYSGLCTTASARVWTLLPSSRNEESRDKLFPPSILALSFFYFPTLGIIGFTPESFYSSCFCFCFCFSLPVFL